MNQTTIAGHLGNDPEVRFTSSNKKVTTFRVAARARKSAKGEETIWWRVTIWGDLFDQMIPYFKKGSAIIVVGEMNKPEIFTDRDGKAQISLSLTAHNLQFNPFGKGDGAGVSHETAQPEPSFATVGEPARGQVKSTSMAIEEELPF